MEPSAALLPLSEVSSGEHSQRLRGGAPAPLFSEVQKELEFTTVTGMWEPALPTGSRCGGLIFLTQTVSVSRSGSYPGFLKPVKSCFLEEV